MRNLMVWGAQMRKNASVFNASIRNGLKWAGRSLMVLGMAALASCSNFSLPSTSGFTNPLAQNQNNIPLTGALPGAIGQSFGTGPVRVALLLPMTGELASVGQSMANSAQLAIDFIASSDTMGDNITLVIKDTAGDSNVAAQKANEAVSEGASLILGPLRAEGARSAGAVARAAGIPVISFSNNSGAAAPGVYLLNVLPEVEAKRSLSYAQTLGKNSVAAIVPKTTFGQIHEGALRSAASELGMNVSAVYQFGTEAEARAAVSQMTPFLLDGSIDTVFMPEPSTAPSFGALLTEAGVDKGSLTIIGSVDWDSDPGITQTANLVGAIYPDLDDAGFNALRPEYEAKFGTTPHPFATLVYTSVLLANSPALAQSQPRYDAAQLTRPSGFNGRDGVFRFDATGRSQFALAMKQIVVGSAQQVDGPKIP